MPSTQPTSDGTWPDDPSVAAVRLLVEAPDRDRLGTVVTDALGPADELGRPWLIEPLFRDAADTTLAGYWTVAGAVPSAAVYDTSRVAYDMAAALARELGSRVEPDLPSSAYGLEPGEGPLTEALGGGAVVHLPGSVPPDWAVRAVRAPEAWRLDPPPDGAPMGEGILVASIDTGYTDHPEMAGVWSFELDWDVIDSDDDARDPLRRRWFGLLDSPGHGTHTASVVASPLDDIIIGAAPRATVVPIRAIQSVVQVLDGNVARAVREAHLRGCHVITMSLGGRGFFGLRAAIQAAVDDGVIVMAAAGNVVGVVVAPAVYPECLAVAATNAADRPWSGSSRGRGQVDVAAPGESVWVAAVDSSAVPPRFHANRQHGTSYAVATLAGVAALWLAHHGRDRIIEQVGRPNVQRTFRQLLVGPGCRVPDGWDDRFGAGIVDASALLSAPLPTTTELALPPPPSSFDAVARLGGVLAEFDRDQVRIAVADLLGLPADQVDRLQGTAVSELVYRIGADDTLRSRITGQLPFVPDIRQTGARELLWRSASRALLTAAAELPT
jgi:Subtilase family